MKKILLILLALSLTACDIQVGVEKETDQNDFFYEQYDQDEKQEVYNAIYNALLNKQMEIELGSVSLSSDEIFSIATQVSDDHPEFFYFFGDCSYSSKDYVVYKKVYLTLKYAYTIEQIQAYETQLAAITETYLEGISNLDEMGVIKYTYDYLIQNVSYDYTTLENLPAVLDEPDGYGLIGALINHTCVCAGYAKAFQYLLNTVGYDCLYIRGYLNGESHAWNAVNIGGSYYHFDVTSDDNNDGSMPFSFYHYFGLNTTQILQNHIIDNFVSETTDTSYNYHIYYGHYLTSIDQLDTLMNNQKGNSVISIQCSSYELYQEVIEKLINNKNISSYYSAGTISYILFDPLYLVQFYTM